MHDGIATVRLSREGGMPGRMLKKAVSKAAASEVPRRTLWGTLRI